MGEHRRIHVFPIIDRGENSQHDWLRRGPGIIQDKTNGPDERKLMSISEVGGGGGGVGVIRRVEETAVLVKGSPSGHHHGLRDKVVAGGS